MTHGFSRAALLAFLLSACSGAPSADVDAPAAEKLALEKRILFVKDGDMNGRKVTKHAAVFGNWAAECTWSRGGDGALSFCDVYPWNGKLPRRATVISPYEERATVQYYEDQGAKIVLNTSARAAGSELAYSCGSAKWEGAESADQLKFFYKEEAQKFISQMKTAGCVISYTPRGGAASVEVARTSHGFREANEYAASFSRYPKEVAAQS